MVEEVRNLLFTPDEVRAALTVMMRMQGEKFPGDRMPRITYTPKDELCLVELSYSRPGGHNLVFKFAESQVAAALIMFCRREGIPMPQRASKELQLRGDALSLIVRMGQKRETKMVPAQTPRTGTEG